MSTKHTKGPWVWSDKFKTFDNERNTWSLLGEGGYGILSCDGDANSPQCLGASGEANARLIAAAPELLEALKLVTDVYAAMRETLSSKYPADGWSAETMTIDAARAAIAKATGEQA